MIKNLFFIILGFYLLVQGSDLLVNGASKIAKKFHIPKIIIGLTIVAIGTSLPELVVSVHSALEEHADISLGNVIGSNIVNLLFILGICATIKPLTIKENTKKFENPFMIVLTVLVIIFGNSGRSISKLEGIIFIILCVLYLMKNMKIMKEEIEEEKNMGDAKILKSILDIVLGILALKYGGEFVVHNSVSLARILRISEKFISITIISLSTSLPEFFTSVAATKKGETDIAIGNIIGSQIFNITLVLGVSSFLNPVEYGLSYNFEMIVLLISTIIFTLFPYIKNKNEMTRKNGAIFVIMYVIYMYILLTKTF